MPKIRIVLADDHAVVREGLKTLIQAHPNLEVVGEASDGLRAVELVAELDPDVVVVDVSMPGLSGAEVTRRLLAANPARRVLALTVHEDRGYLRLLLDAGAAGYVLKRAAAGNSSTPSGSSRPGRRTSTRRSARARPTRPPSRPRRPWNSASANRRSCARSRSATATKRSPRSSN